MGKLLLPVFALTLALFAGAASGAAGRLSDVRGVEQAAFNHDGSHVIVLTREGMVSLWNAANSAAVAGPVNGPAQAFTVSEDGHTVLVGSPEGGARLFSMESGAAVSPALDVHPRVPAHPEAVFSPDGTRVLIFERGSAAVFEASSGKRLAKLPIGPTEGEEDLELAPSAAFTKDGTRCLVMTAGGVVTGYDAANWKPLGPPMHHPAADSAYKFNFSLSDDGRWMATFDNPGENGPKGNLQTWDTSKAKPLGKPFIAVNGMEGRFLPASSRLLIIPGRGEASVRDLPTFRKSCTIPAHDEVDGPSVLISPDGKWILSWGSDRIVRLQSAATGAVQESQAFQARISQVLVLPDSSGCLVVFDNSSFLLQDYYDHYVLKIAFPDLQATHSLRLTEYLNRVAMSPNGRRILIQAGKTGEEQVLLFETADLKPTRQ